MRYSYVKHCYPWKISENTAFREIRCQRANRSIWSDFHDTVTAKVASGITLLIYFFRGSPFSYIRLVTENTYRFTSYVKLSVCYACPILMFYSSGESKAAYATGEQLDRSGVRYRRWHNILFQSRFFYIYSL